MLFACVDELVVRRERGEDGPNLLEAETLGKWSADA
jgi:hypothetical protein